MWVVSIKRLRLHNLRCINQSNRSNELICYGCLNHVCSKFNNSQWLAHRRQCVRVLEDDFEFSENKISFPGVLEEDFSSEARHSETTPPVATDEGIVCSFSP